MKTQPQTLSHSLFKIALAPSVILILHILASIFGWYEQYWWFDIPLHFFGGASIAIASYYLLKDYEQRNIATIRSPILRILILIAFVGFAAAVWECMEFAFDTYTKTSLQVSLLDTIKDIAMGISGGGLTALLITAKNILNKK